MSGVVAVIDYGMGNLHSVASALSYAGASEVLVTQAARDAIGTTMLEIRGETFDLAELDGRDMVGLEDSGPAAELTRNRFENAEIEPAVVVTAHTHYVAASLVRLGVGASIVDEFTARSIAGHGLNLARCSDAMHLPFTAMQLSEAGANPLLDSCMEELRTLVG